MMIQPKQVSEELDTKCGLCHVNEMKLTKI